MLKLSMMNIARVLMFDDCFGSLLHISELLEQQDGLGADADYLYSMATVFEFQLSRALRNKKTVIKATARRYYERALAIKPSQINLLVDYLTFLEDNLSRRDAKARLKAELAKANSRRRKQLYDGLREHVIGDSALLSVLPDVELR
jgi:hypothetical protein